VNRIDDLGRILAISPHLGDGVAGCGALLAAYPGGTVVTVFAGMPDPRTPLTEQDAQAKHPDGAAAMRSRRAEDDKALHLLKMQPVRLDFLEDPYAKSQGLSTPKAERIATSLTHALEKNQARTVLFPLGLALTAHTLVSDAALLVYAALPELNWIAYEDAIYRDKPGLLQLRLVQFYKRGISLTPVVPAIAVNIHRKASAVAAYTGQLTEAGSKKADSDLAAPERYWLLREAVKQDAP
jgi:LmbE family N-acetylglucosaminyl deacetylase